MHTSPQDIARWIVSKNFIQRRNATYHTILAMLIRKLHVRKLIFHKCWP